MTREILKILNQGEVDNPTFPVNLRFFTPFQDPGGMLSRSMGMPSSNDRPPSICDTHGISGNVFVNSTASSSALYPQGINPWISNVSEHTSPHVMSESQTHRFKKKVSLEEMKAQKKDRFLRGRQIAYLIY